MADKVASIKVELDLSRLKQLQAGLKPRAHQILDKAALDVEAIAKTLAPVLTGALRASIYTSGLGGKGSSYGAHQIEAAGKGSAGGVKVEFVEEVMPAGPFERIVGPSVIYGIWPEVKGQPYLVPAVEQVRQGFERAWERLFD